MKDIEPEDVKGEDQYKIALEFGSRLLHLVHGAKSPRRAVYEIFFAIGRDAELSITESDIAKMYGISKQAFSKGVGEMREKLGLPSLQRSEAARGRYRLTHPRWHGPRNRPAASPDAPAC